MTATLIIDNREHALIAELTRIGVTHTVAQLDVGDIQISNADGQPIFVAERKSHADFAASNQDGRYREQRARLMAVRGGGVAVVYILEGAWTGNDDRTYGSRTTEGLLRRLTTRLILRYGMPVIMSSSVAETAIWCKTLLAQLTDDADVFQPEDDMAAATANALTTMTAVLSTAKKGNKSPATTAMAMLSAIPGLGTKRIEALCTEHSIVDLAAMSGLELAALVVGGKRLGEKIGSAIFDAFHTRLGC